MDKIIREYLGMRHSLVGIKILRESTNPELSKKPKKRMRFCELVKEAAAGSSFEEYLEDEACPEAAVALGFEEPTYVDVQPRISPAQTKVIKIAPLEESANPDVVLAILNPRQAMQLAALLDGVEAKFSGSIACGEAVAKPYMDKKPNISFLCGGARTFADFKDSEIIFGAPPETFKRLAEKIEALSKTCGALCGCKTSDIPPRIVQNFKKLGFEKGIDYFFGKVNERSVRIYLNKDASGRIKYITIHLPMKGEVRVKAPFVLRKRGEWSDVSITLQTGEGIELNTGRGLKETIEDIVAKFE